MNRLNSLLLCACTAPAVSAAQGWQAPELEHSVSVRNGRTGERLSFTELLDELARADAVFLGETHIDETTHRVELAVYEGLLERRDGAVVLAMEMFERDVQSALDAYLADEIDEATFRERARPWGNYDTAYRPLIERARAAGRPVVASNFPRPLRMRLSMEGPGVLGKLDVEQRPWAPLELSPNTPAYWRRVDNAVRGHRGMMDTSEDDATRLYSTQTLWDNSMGESCALALDRHPGASVVHVNGGFHSAYWDGTVRQFRLRRPDASVKTVDIATSANPDVAELSGVPVADFVVFAEARASDLNDGVWSVEVSRGVRYNFHLPKSASSAAPVPLLIWLSGDGFGADEGLQLWRDRLGDEAAIAVLEAPYRETQPDLSAGGRWFWPDTFTADVGAMHEAIERVWGYLLRHYPLDARRVCLAGEGTGATVVGAAALFTERMDVHAVSLSPRHYRKVKDFSLPLPEYRGDEPAPDKSLRILAAQADADWWREELAEYTGVGFANEFSARTSDPWQIELEAEGVLRSALGLPARTAPSGRARRHLVLEDPTPRALLWARLLALDVARREGCEVALLERPLEGADSEAIAVALEASYFAQGDALPRCPGPFGGTTVLVLPDGMDDASAAPWRALEEADPLNAQSRFHRVRVSTAAALPASLAELLEANRKNVLIVPVQFCAGPGEMRALGRSVAELEDRMTIQWSPGLGARLSHADKP